MSNEIILPLIMRWMHILSAIIGVGGTIFVGFVLNPAMQKGLADDAREAFRNAVMKRWKIFIHPTIILFLLSGFYNYIVVTSPLHRDQSLYHILFGVKFLLALLFFAVVIVATSTLSWSKRLRERGGMWTLQILLATAIVLVAGLMKSLPQQTTSENEIQQTTAER